MEFQGFIPTERLAAEYNQSIRQGESGEFKHWYFFKKKIIKPCWESIDALVIDLCSQGITLYDSLLPKEFYTGFYEALIGDDYGTSCALKKQSLPDDFFTNFKKVRSKGYEKYVEAVENQYCEEAISRTLGHVFPGDLLKIIFSYKPHFKESKSVSSSSSQPSFKGKD